MNNVLSINERATEHCAQMAPSDLVSLWRAPDVDEILPNPTTSCKGPSTDQRCFSQFDRKTDYFDGGIGLFSSNPVAVGKERGSNPQPLGPASITFKAVCGTQTRMPQGFKLMDNKIQALSTPDNLVGGALNASHTYMPGGALNHPVEGTMPGYNIKVQ